MGANDWRTHNPSGSKRVVCTKELPGTRWLEVLEAADCKVEIGTSTDILSVEEIKEKIGDRCDGVIGQLTEKWGEELFSALKNAGGKAYSNYAVGYNNVDVGVATKYGIPVGNTPGVLTETTAEMAISLTFSAARRVVEGDAFMRAEKYKGWLPTLYLGELMNRKTVGVLGAGRIGATYAKMMVEGFKMNLVYFDPYPNEYLENYIKAYGEFLKAQGDEPVTCQRLETAEDVLKVADVVSLHPILDDTTFHLMNTERLGVMKDNAILVNASRGPVIDEAALVEHCKSHPNFRVGLDVFEDEPLMKPGLKDLDNVVIVPHIASATIWTRSGMATLAGSNIAGILNGYGAWPDPDGVLPFLGDNPPKAAPSIVNAEEVGVAAYSG
ncbi:MAG: NAD(P)-dependent oxidoreductase [bacterium]|nr:NAD(P)-dependent oxidoreductase [bacterium]